MGNQLMILILTKDNLNNLRFEQCLVSSRCFGERIVHQVPGPTAVGYCW